ncbi:MAG: sugar ABC transporter permease [Chloroflexi bacterium]|nr:sugar ABC transporter permease [Chloroflexota bacterium]
MQQVKASTAAAASRPATQWLRKNRDRLIAIGLISPSVIAIAVFVYGFIGFTAFSSLTRWDSLTPDFTLVGLRNYTRLFTIDRFLSDLRNTVTFTALFLAACLAIGLGLAILLDQGVKGEAIFRTIFLFPMAISYIVTGVVWRWLLNPGTIQTGSSGINLLFERLGLGFLKSPWFTDPTIIHIPPDSWPGAWLVQNGFGVLASPRVGISVAMISVVLAATWQMSGYTMALYLAGLRGVPDELREAARVDGATELQVYRYVVLPILRPITLSAVIILGHISLKIFDLVVSMTGPGPAFATDVPAFFMFDTTFRGNNFAQGAAIATMLLFTVALLIVPYLVYTTRTEAEL